MQRLVAALIFSVATAGAAVAQSAMSGFTSIEAEGNFRVEITQGDAYSVNLSGADVGSVSMRVRGDELRITRSGQNWLQSGPPLDAVVRVTTPRLARLKSTRGAQVRVAAPRAGSLAVEASTGAQIELTGGCEGLEAKASMGGEINAQALRCDNVTATASMGGNIQAQARRQVEASASMGGNIEITGDPPRRSANTSMGGDVTIH